MLCLAKPISPGSIWSETNYFIWKNISSEIITQGDGHWALHVLHFVLHNIDFYIKTAFKVYNKSKASGSTVKLSKTQSFCEENFWQKAGAQLLAQLSLKPLRTHRCHHHQCTLPGHNRNANRMLQDTGALLAPKVTRQSNIFLIINPKVFDRLD